MEYILNCGDLEVVFSTLGAEMISVKYKKVERLWQNDNNTWTGHAPILFPIAGKINVKIDGIIYPLLQHGFARRREFTLISKSINTISFKLSYSTETLEVYPYKFELYVNYELVDNSINISYITKNIDSIPIYYSIGSHTSFSFPKTIDNYCIEFEKKEPLVNYINDTYPSLTGDTITLSNDGILDLSTEYIDNKKTIIFKNLKSERAILKEKNGKPLSEIIYHGFPYILFWHPLDSKMVCMEPWHNILDSKDDSKEFKDKDGIIMLNPGEEKELNQTIIYY